MRNLARVTATAGLAVAFAAVAVPSASAAVHQAASPAKTKSSAPSSMSAKKAAAKKAKAAQQAAVKKAVAKALAERPTIVNIYYVMHDGRVVSEQGPGNLAAHEVESSGAVDMQSQNQPITTGDMRADRAKGPVTFEVEGSEQDTGEVS